MNNFVSEYPQIAISLLTLAVSIIGALLSILMWMLKQSIDRVVMRIDDFGNILGSLLDRMQKQEATCQERAKHCPELIRAKDEDYNI